MTNAFVDNAPSRYPSARWVASPHFTPGNRGRLAVCLHIAEGGYQSSIDFMKNAGVSSHFIIAENGSVSQMVSIHDTAFGNGLSYNGVNWISPRNKVVHPTWQRIEKGVNPNLTTISIEHAGFHNKARSAVQIQATVALLKWLAGWFPSLNPYVPGRTLIGHRDLDTVDRINCPGPHFDFAAIARAANPAPTTTVRYTFPGLKVYRSSMLIGEVAVHLPDGAQIDIDVIGGPGYAAYAGHIKKATFGDTTLDGPGFVDIRLLV